MSVTVTSLVEVLQNILQPTQLQTLRDKLSQQYPDAADLAKSLVERGWLTHFQLDQIFKDQGSQLVLGRYLMLEHLGEGGMGQVFKARDKTLERVVALKVIRQEHLAHDPEAVRRFQREAKAAALLQHPNVVVVYDCDQVENTYYIAMQYLEGIDLSRLVKEHGPMPVHKACDFVRQAALGLQHAHEHQMVHRDIKPSNLFATFSSPPKTVEAGVVAEPSSAPTVPGTPLAKVKQQSAMLPIRRYDLDQPATIKILDMGLVRINRAGEKATSMSLTQEGSMVGTPDYIAPEQARNAHRVDIRADLYSLGCTFYYLLTGQPPFTEGSAIEKLLAHQLDEPTPVENVRPDVPPGVGAIVRRLMAKRPMDRFQLPSEVSDLLAPLVHAPKQPGPPPPRPPMASAPTPPPSMSSQRTSPVAIRFGSHATGKYAPTPSKPSSGSGEQVAASVYRWAGGSKTPTPTPAPASDSGSGSSEAATLVDKRKGHNGCVMSLAFSQDRNVLATGGVDARIFIWDYAQAKPRQRALLGGHQDNVQVLAISPDGSVLASGSGAVDGMIFLWDMREDRPGRIATLTGHQGPVESLGFSADGKLLASGGGDKTVRIWDIANGFRSKAVLKGHTDGVKAVAFAPDGGTMASAGADRSIRLWNMGRTLWSKERAVLTGHSNGITGLAFSPSGAMLASISVDQTVRIWNVTSVQPKLSMVLEGQEAAIRSLVFATDSKTLMTAGDTRSVLQWDLTSGEKLREWLLPKAMHSCYSFTNDCRYLAAGTSDGPVLVFRMGEKRSPRSGQGAEKK